LIQLRLKQFSLDWPLFFSLLMLMAVGLVVIYSSSNQNTEMILRQGFRIGVSLFALIVFAQIDPDRLYRWSPYIFFVGLVLLGLVLMIGITGKGAFRFYPTTTV